MKRRLFVIMIMVAVFSMFASCTKEEEPVVSEEPSNVDVAAIESESQEPVVEVEPVDGVVYVNNAAFYTEQDDGKMKWALSAKLGTVATYLGETKEAQRTDGQKRTFFHVSYDGKDYWTQDYCYEPDTVAGFIKDAGTLFYTLPELTAVTDEEIPQYFIVAVYNDSLAEDSDFVKIAMYSDQLLTWVVKGKYVKRNAVEVSKSDVAAMNLAQIATESRNETIRNELFSSAVELGSAYTEQISELSTLTSQIVLEEDYLKTVDASKFKESVVLASDVDLLSIPIATGNTEIEARVLGSLKNKTKATTSKTVVFPNEAGDEVWYYIHYRQKKGWVKAESLVIEQK